MKAAFIRCLPIALAMSIVPRFALHAQKTTNWAEYLGGPSSAHYSPLKQVNTRNVDKLEVAWSYPTGDQQSYYFSPLVVDNVAYVAAKQGTLGVVVFGDAIFNYVMDNPLPVRCKGRTLHLCGIHDVGRGLN